ncbi:S16 family serine protease [Thermococcus alcaliphilus]|uniref:S16 family serine protease n=1 Tax=Thermococcus alcaliphilus TaxID=139207 RepID=UPI00209154E1|nr:S16 family serine protease [Thermococcus alcaliphilus]MCO6040319.1 ATP-dependent protease [Thermococcus alcaliphilus]
MKKILSMLALILLLLPLANAQCPEKGNTVVLKAPAVSRTSSGELIGVATDFVITVAPGNGHVYVETWPLAEVDMQASARLAAQVAGKVLGVDMSKYDVFIQVKSDAPIIGGPSAGGTMTVGIIAALEGWKVRNDVMMTGMINPDGSIGPVGGILEKASAAHSVGAKLFLIPEGQRIQVVQKTEQKQIGPIVQITSKSEKVDVVEYAKERWGLEVKEIRDIYEAVYYFTGKKIEKPSVPGELRVDTSFLKDDALKDYDETLNYYKQVENKLKNSDVSYTTYSYLKNALDDAKAKLDEAKKDLDEGMYYTALSLDFQARIAIRHVDWYLDVKTDSDLENLLKEVDNEIKSTESYVSNLTIKGITMLQAVAASEERVEEAKSLLKDAWSSYYDGNYWDAISNAAFAYERIQTAKFWASLGERYAKGDVIERDAIKDTAREYLDNSRLIITYITSMFGETNLQDLVNLMNEGEEYYQDGKYSAAIFSAMEARIRAEIILDTLGIDNETVLMDKLQRMKEDAKVAIAIAQKEGIYPVLSLAYYEFAQSYEKQGGLESIQTAMVFYQYAKETSTVFLSTTTPPKITEEPLIPLTTPLTNQTTPQNTTSPAQKETSGYSIPLIAGTLVIGLLLGFIAGRKA